MPIRRHLCGLGVAAIGHPSALVTVVAVFGGPRLIVFVAKLVFADEVSIATKVPADANCGPIPPRENRLEQGGLPMKSGTNTFVRL